MHNFWHSADTQSLWIVELINELEIFRDKRDIPMWHNVTETNIHGHHHFLLVASHLFTILFLKVALRAETLGIYPPHDNCKINNNIFGRSVKMKFTKRERKKESPVRKETGGKWVLLYPVDGNICLLSISLSSQAKALLLSSWLLTLTAAWFNDGWHSRHTSIVNPLPLRPLPVHVHSTKLSLVSWEYLIPLFHIHILS